MHRLGQLHKNVILAVVDAKLAVAARHRGVILPEQKAQPLVHRRLQRAAVVDLHRDVHRAVAVKVAAQQLAVVAQRAALDVAHAAGTVGLQKARCFVIQNDVRYQTACAGPGIHDQVHAVVAAGARVQGRAAAVDALAQVQRLGRAELAVVGGQQLQRHAAQFSVRRQSQNQILRVALAGEVRDDHVGIALADDRR